MVREKGSLVTPTSAGFFYVQRRDLLTTSRKNFYIIPVLSSLSGGTVVAHIVSRPLMAFAAATLTVFP